MSIEILGFAAGVLGISFNIPQIIKIIKTKSARDISILSPILLISQSILWAIYGLILDLVSIYVVNFLMITVASILVILKLKYRGSELRVKK